MRPGTFSLLMLCAVSAAFAQEPAESASFEVASIKPADPSTRGLSFSGGPGTDSPGQLTIKNYPLNLLIRRAFDKSRPWEMVIPDSVPSDRYDIVAKAQPGVTRERFYLMIQRLLVERFGLVAHKEIREILCYELVAANDRPRLTPVKTPSVVVQADETPRPRVVISALPKDKDGWPILPPDAVGRFGASVPPYNRTMFRAQPFSALLEYLRFVLDRPVVDRTGLSGIYNYDLDVLRPEPPTTTADMSPAERSQALREADSRMLSNLLAGVERLGVKVVSTKGPVEVVVVEKVNKKPTEN